MDNYKITAETVTECAICLNTSYCEIHENEQIKLYCNDCKQPICMMCKTLDHAVHSCVDLKIALNIFRTELKQRFPDLVKCCANIALELKHANDVKEDFLQQISKINEQISDTYQVMLSAIQRERDELLQKLSTLKEERLKEIQTKQDEAQHKLVIIQSFKKYTEELLEHSLD